MFGNETGFSNAESKFFSGKDKFNHPSEDTRLRKNNLGTNMTNHFSNMSKSSNRWGDDSRLNGSSNTQFKSMKEDSQKTIIEVPFKSFLFEKCLFYFYAKDIETLMFKKKILEHSGSIVKNYNSLTRSQLSGRDFFMIFGDGFVYKEVN